MTSLDPGLPPKPGRGHVIYGHLELAMAHTRGGYWWESGDSECQEVGSGGFWTLLGAEVAFVLLYRRITNCGTRMMT